MTTIATLAVQLIADTSEFVQGMQEAQGQAQETKDNISDTFSNMGTSLQMSGMMWTQNVTKPILDFGEQALNSAGDLEGAKNRVSVVFGDMSSSVEAWSQNSATAFGESQTDALNNASAMDIWANQADLSGQAASSFSESNMELAANMAAFFHTSPQDAMSAIESGYGGMYRELKQYGVVIGETQVKQEAQTLGLYNGTGALTEHARILATNQLIMQQTSETSGYFARSYSRFG